MTRWFRRALITAPFIFAICNRPAFAFSTPLRIASGDIPATCVSCTPVTDTPTAATPITAMRIPSTGGYVIVHATMPRETTSPIITTILTRLIPTSTSGNICDRVCYGVVSPGQTVDAADLTACNLTTADPVLTQWDTMVTDFASSGITPRDTSGSPCTVGGALGPTNCQAGELYIKVERIAVGSCASGSAADVDYLSVIPIFQ
jgi:hypothetical protein